MIAFISLHAVETINFSLSLKMEFGIRELPSIELQTFIISDLQYFSATSHLCIKREWPLIISYSLYSKNIIHYHFYLNHIREGE